MTTYEQVLQITAATDPQRLLIIDGHSWAYRAFYGIPDLTSPTGQPVGAIFGFWRAFVQIMRAFPSDHVAVTFDASGPTFRHNMYPQYKATRSPMPEELRSQIPLIQRLLEELGVPVFSVSGVEADDVMATLATQASLNGYTSLIASSDKDLAQLVNDDIFLLRPAGRGIDSSSQIIDAYGVEAKFGVPPEKIVDLLSLIGDSSDNVPGVPAVGEKTATKLLQQFSTLASVLASAGKVGNRRVAENLVTYADDARRAQELIRLRIDLELGDIPADCRLKGISLEPLVQTLTEFGFSSVLNEIGQAPSALAVPKSPAVDVAYSTILKPEQFDALLSELAGASIVSIDLETTSTDPHQADIVGIALSMQPLVGYYIPIGHNTLDAPAQLDLSLVLEALRPFLEAQQPQLIGQNIKYDLIILKRYGIHPAGISFDAMIASHLTQPEEHRHNLERIASDVLGCSMISFEDVAGKDGSFAAVPVESATIYAAEDAEIVQRLREPLLGRLQAQNLLSLFDTVEMPLVPVLAGMELNGISLDAHVLAAQGDEIRKELEILESDLFDIAGEPFNPNSPKQVAEILFFRLGLPMLAKTKSGPSTSAQVLTRLAELHPLPGKLIVHRELRKLLSTYIDQLPKAIHPVTGRIHSSFHQTSTATGRLSSSDPNLQNIPTRTETGGRIRSAFVAPPGHRFVAADYSQIELRLLAHFSQDDNLLDGFRSGVDLHRLTASHVFGLPENEVTDQLRDAAKRINFGILYGISPFGLGRELRIPQSEAKGYIDRFFAAYPKAKETLDRLVETATRNGYAETLMGRRRPLPNLTSRNMQQRNFDRRNAVNTPIQGSAADLIKLAMIHIDQKIRNQSPSVKMILQIHDELVFEVPEHLLEPAIALIRDGMENVYPLSLPLTVKVSTGINWGEL
ncbi:DNA polymerase I [Candidatus Bipolaricaulota bacterium]|nr:DNA polymerase I [Candidatus Bipolaricaulota bacterium]